MPFRIGKSLEIESGCLLSKPPGKCRFPNGHSRRVEVVLAAAADLSYPFPIPPGVRVEHGRVGETSSCWAEY